MNKPRKTIVILTPGFPQDEQDTTCIPFLQDYVSALARLRPDYKILVIAFQYPHKTVRYKWRGVEVYSAGGKSKKGLDRIITWRKIWKELKKINKEEGIDLLHSMWFTESCLVAQRFSKCYQIRHVAYAIGQDVLKTNKYLKLLDFDSMYLTAMSEALAERFKEVTGKQIKQIICSGVDENKTSIPRSKKTIDVIGVGALNPLKNYGLFIDIMASLQKDFPGIKACIIGKGEQEQMLKEKISSARLNANIELVGEIPHDKVFSYLGKSKIFLHTSNYEGQSTVLMEALTMGLTVVCFDVGRIHVEGKMIVCKSKEEMIKELGKLLTLQLDDKPSLKRTVDDMVKDFVKVYEL